MTVSSKDKAQKAMHGLMLSAMKNSSKENVSRAVFNASYVDDFQNKQNSWRSKWLKIWLMVGLVASFVSGTSWSLAMMPRFGLLNIDVLIVSWLLILMIFSTVIALISAVGMTSIGKTPNLPKLL